jgi:hypothetical protein
MLMAACCKRKGEVQGDSAPIRVWKDISSELQDNGVRFNYDECRSKFMTLNEYFSGTMLPLKGVIGGVMWQHFNSFLDLHDIPRDYIPQVGLQTAEEPSAAIPSGK